MQHRPGLCCAKPYAKLIDCESSPLLCHCCHAECAESLGALATAWERAAYDTFSTLALPNDEHCVSLKAARELADRRVTVVRVSSPEMVCVPGDYDHPDTELPPILSPAAAARYQRILGDEGDPE